MEAEQTEQTVAKPRKPGTFVAGHPPYKRKGGVHRVTKDLKRGIIDAAAELGSDGKGTGGLQGYLSMCARKYPRHYMQLLAKMLPLQVNADGFAGSTISSVNIVSIPTNNFLSSVDIERLRMPGRLDEESQPLLEHTPTPVPQASEPAPSEQEIIDSLKAEIDELARRAGISL